MSDTTGASDTTGGASPRGEPTRIALSRAVAVIKPHSIVVRPARSALWGPVIQALLTALVVLAMIAWINVLPLWVLMILLFVVIISGPTAILGLVYNVLGSSFLMERQKGTCRWQQGFLGLGLGTHELVPFPRIDHLEVSSDFEDELGSGDLQDVVRWEVRLVKDNGRVLSVASITAARPLADEALERANALAAALGEMSGKPANLGEIPDWALEDYEDSDDFDGETMEEVEDA